MTASMDCFGGTQLLATEILTTAGTYTRTPPAGANFVVMKAIGAGGYASRNQPGATGAAGKGALVIGMIACGPADTFELDVGAGGQYSGTTPVPGGDASTVKKNGTSLLIAGGGGSANADNPNSTALAGNGGVTSGDAGSFYTASSGYVGGQGGGGTQSSNGFEGAGPVGGGGGYFQGGEGGEAGGGGSSFISGSLSHSSGFQDTYSDTNFSSAVGRGGQTNGATTTVKGNDGGVVVSWYSGDPYAAGILN